MEQESLDKILEGPAESPPEATEQPETLSEQVQRERDERGRFTSSKDEGGEVKPPEQAPPAQAAPPAAEQPTVPRAALEDERRKRQELEARLQSMEQQFRQPAETEAPDFWEDPNAVISNQVATAVQAALQGWEMKQMQAEADRSEAAAKAKYPDYEDAFAKFREQVQFNPGLINELQMAADKAEFAYRRGKQALELSQVGDLDALKAQIRAQVEAELRASAPVVDIPTTTAGQRSVGDRGGPAWAGPQPLSAILS